MRTLLCVCPPRVESLFPPVLPKSCNQIPLAFKVWISRNSSSRCQTPRLGNLTCGSEPSLQWVDFCGISVLPLSVYICCICNSYLFILFLLDSWSFWRFCSRIYSWHSVPEGLYQFKLSFSPFSYFTNKQYRCRDFSHTWRPSVCPAVFCAVRTKSSCDEHRFHLSL